LQNGSAGTDDEKTVTETDTDERKRNAGNQASCLVSSITFPFIRPACSLFWINCRPTVYRYDPAASAFVSPLSVFECGCDISRRGVVYPYPFPQSVSALPFRSAFAVMPFPCRVRTISANGRVKLSIGPAGRRVSRAFEWPELQAW